MTESQPWTKRDAFELEQLVKLTNTLAWYEQQYRGLEDVRRHLRHSIIHTQDEVEKRIHQLERKRDKPRSPLR